MCGCFSFFKYQDPAINSLRHKIRFGLEENNPSILGLWLSMEENVGAKNTFDQWSLYKAQYRLLIDTLSDDMLPNHWRACCLDHIYKPLIELNKLAITEHQVQQLNRLYYELRVTSNFFQSGLVC